VNSAGSHDFETAYPLSDKATSMPAEQQPSARGAPAQLSQSAAEWAIRNEFVTDVPLLTHKPSQH
jgi:hypothetical protein